LVHGAHVGIDDLATYLLAGDKDVTTSLLRQADLPTPAGGAFDPSSPVLRRLLTQRGVEWVVKPAANTAGGRGVTVGPMRRATALRAIADAAAYGPRVVCEERIEGRVVRVLVFDGEVLDGVERVPARVDGDGASSVDQLVAAENARRAALGARSTGFVSTGVDYRAALERAGVTRKTRLPADAAITVSGRSNSGSERESRRVAVGRAVAEGACRAAATIGARLAGVDVVVSEDGALRAILEVNTTPGLHWHQFVTGQPFDVFGALLSRVAAAPRSP
jgi:D-alanine-D-alanine ligase-like ATP-grasp enzyme